MFRNAQKVKRQRAGTRCPDFHRDAAHAREEPEVTHVGEVHALLRSAVPVVKATV